jgi:hypothetical protein
MIGKWELRQSTKHRSIEGHRANKSSECTAGALAGGLRFKLHGMPFVRSLFTHGISLKQGLHFEL